MTEAAGQFAGMTALEAREATSKDINENWRGNYPRLVAAKKKYDPTNLFRLNANVQLEA